MTAPTLIESSGPFARLFSTFSFVLADRGNEIGKGD